MVHLDRGTGTKNKFNKNSSIFCRKTNISIAHSFRRTDGRLELIFDFIKAKAEKSTAFLHKENTAGEAIISGN